MSSSPMYCVDVLFEGSKTFWKFRATVDIVVVEHVDEDVIETIIHNPANDYEFPRLYASTVKVAEAMDKEEFDENLKFMIQVCERKEKPYDEKKLAHNVRADLMSLIIVNNNPIF
mmetsp:Transcript_24502/g.40850  ORF Transcript_24502/g.40850 Transcript_24502/m.40850 type:complete len:115 (-) Transcript_24502:750-1094(-)